tara:strand:+ start:16900 stop:17118 length:219 start_codon:yes stop_codon:yes gene_type:complete
VSEALAAPAAVGAHIRHNVVVGARRRVGAAGRAAPRGRTPRTRCTTVGGGADVVLQLPGHPRARSIVQYGFH